MSQPTARHLAPASPATADRRHRRRTALVAWVVALALPAGTAFALWTVGGTGNGQAKATTSQNLTVAAGTASAQLYPGAAGDVVFRVTNPNAFAVKVTGISLGAVAGSGTCGASNFTTAAGTVAPVTVAAGQSADVTVVGGLGMVTAAGNECQGVTVTVAGTVTAAQA